MLMGRRNSIPHRGYLPTLSVIVHLKSVVHVAGDRGGRGRERVSSELSRRYDYFLEPIFCCCSPGRRGFHSELRGGSVQGATRAACTDALGWSRCEIAMSQASVPPTTTDDIRSHNERTPRVRCIVPSLSIHGRAVGLSMS